jgi:hypothetical protein
MNNLTSPLSAYPVQPSTRFPRVHDCCGLIEMETLKGGISLWREVPVSIKPQQPIGTARKPYPKGMTCIDKKVYHGDVTPYMLVSVRLVSLPS